jgi:acyl carrier protein
MNSILEELIKIADEIYPGFKCNNSLDDLDSFALMELMVALEQKFAITFTADDFSYKNFSSVDKIENLIKIKLKEKIK